MIGTTRIKEITDRVLAASTAPETEVVVFGAQEQLTRFANNGIHQNVATSDVAVVVRVVVERRTGVGVTNDVSRAGLERAVEVAQAQARLQPEDPDCPGLPEPQPLPEVDAFDERTAAYSPQDRARAVEPICRRAREAGIVASGAFATAALEFGVANSHGLFAYHPSTLADLTTVVMAGDGSGYAAGAAWQAEQVDVPAFGDTAIERALRSRNPQSIEPGVYPVVLEPYAVGDIVSFISHMAGGMMVAEGRSWMTGRQGEALVSPTVSIWDDGLDPAGWPLPFDFEGTPRRPVDIIRDGVVGGPVYDRRWAAKASAASTGHALPAHNPFSPWLSAGGLGPLPMHPAMGGGDRTVEEMIASTERGLYVTRFHYTRVVHPRQAVVTGMTRDGLFLIENGEVTVPLKNLRFTQSYIEALANVEMVGKHVHAERPGFAVVRAPALKLSAFHFTGATSF